MSDRFRNKYRIESTRLQNWDYAWDAAYFLTICTKDRQHFFGEIRDDEMHLSNIGVIADVCWYEIENHAKNVELGEYVVMPNHIHGILVLDGNATKTETRRANDNDVGTGRGDDGAVETGHTVETGHALSLRDGDGDGSTEPTIGQQRFQNQGKNTISSIIGGYKSAVTKHANRLGFDMAWQSRFHDHIIRDQQSFDRITDYIKNNPANWKDDRFF